MLLSYGDIKIFGLQNACAFFRRSRDTLTNAHAQLRYFIDIQSLCQAGTSHG